MIVKRTNDLTVGNPIKGILIFMVPIIFGNVFQHMYNLVDTVIVGHILGEEALAAVGATSALYGFFTSMAFGMTNGYSIVIARFFGGRDEKGLKRSLAHTVMLTVISSAVLTLIGVVFARPLLTLLQTPQEIIEQSYSYVIVVLACLLVSMLYNMFAGMLRGIGNSLMPLVFLIISTVCNAVLDVVFVGYVGMGVKGAAWATVLAQLISVFSSLIYVWKKCPQLHVRKGDFKWNGIIAEDLFTNGISMALMFSIVSIGSIALQSAINSLGSITIAAHTAARKIGEMFMMFFTPLSMAGSTYCSQNLGAGKKDRIPQGMRACFVVGFTAAAFVNLITFLAAEPILIAVTGSHNIELIQTSALYLHINLPFYFALTILLTLRSALQGLGHKLIPLLASVIELASKFVVASLLVPHIGYLGVCIVEPLVWIICAILVFTDYKLLMRKMKKQDLGNTVS